VWRNRPFFAAALLALSIGAGVAGAEPEKVHGHLASPRMPATSARAADEFEFAIMAGALPMNAGFLAYDGNGVLSNDFVDLVFDDESSAHEVPFEQQAATDPSYPDITNPGPDTSNFPNGPYTLPKGRSYIENAPVGFYGSAGSVPSSYSWAFMTRYGITDYLEFRIFSSGLTVQDEPDPVTGFYPLAFDVKLHCWEENREFLLPAVGLEIFITTEFGSPAFRSGTQPSLNLLFEQTLLWDIDFSYNFSMTGVENGLGQTAYQFAFDWAFQRDVTECVAVFVQGFYNDQAEPRPVPVNVLPASAVIPSQNIVGAGYVWTLSRRVATWGSYNFGTTSNSPKTIAIAGFAVAF